MGRVVTWKGSAPGRRDATVFRVMVARSSMSVRRLCTGSPSEVLFAAALARALALGEGLPIIGRLLGHRQAETTARYAHLDRDSVRKSAERVAVRIAEHIL